MSELVHRVVAMLSMIPRQPGRTTVAELCARLRERGFEIRNRRMIERDLKSLADSAYFPLASDGKKPAAWYWVRGAQIIDIPCMDPHTALTMELVETFLAERLPRSTLAYLRPYFAKATEVLDRSHAAGLRSWRHKVAAVPAWLEPRPPPVPAPVLAAVYQAVLDEKRLRLAYRKRGASAASELVVDPVGLVFRGAVAYLVCHSQRHDGTLQLPLHRAQAATVLDERAHMPPGTSLQRYLVDGGFEYGATGERVRLRARFERQAAEQLLESSIGADQRVERSENGDLLVEVTVEQSWRLNWWLLSFGDKVEVLEPEGLREVFAEVAERMARKYSTGSRRSKEASRPDVE